MKRVVFLDRDGTVNKEVEYLSSPRQVELCAGAGEGLRRMRNLDLGLVIVTNQSGIGRGYFGYSELHAIHDRLRELVAAYHVGFDAIYVCPHRPEDGCNCRKPRTGLIEQAAADFQIDPSLGFVVGDKPCDIDLGLAIGATTILVRTGYGLSHERSDDISPDFIVEDLAGAASILENLLVKNEGKRSGQ